MYLKQTAVQLTVYNREVLLEMFKKGEFPIVDSCNEIDNPCNSETFGETETYHHIYHNGLDWWNHLPIFEIVKVAHNNIIVRTTNDTYFLSYYLTDGKISTVSEIRIVKKNDIQKMVTELSKTLK